MIKKMILMGVAAASLSTTAHAADKVFNLEDIDPGQAATAQFRHFQKGNGGLVGGQPTEVYATSAKAFSDRVFFNISSVGEGSAVFTVQVLSGAKGFLKNITNGALTLIRGGDQFGNGGETIINNQALVSGAQFVVPFVAGSYLARVTGNASGSRGGDYQISFSAPVPEPAVVGSMGAGLVLAGFIATRRRRKAAVAA